MHSGLEPSQSVRYEGGVALSVVPESEVAQRIQIITHVLVWFMVVQTLLPLVLNDVHH